MIGPHDLRMREPPAIDYSLGTAVSDDVTHTRPPARPLLRSGPAGGLSPPPSYFGRCMGNIKIGQLNGWLVDGREADEEGDNGDGDCGRKRQQRP